MWAAVLRLALAVLVVVGAIGTDPVRADEAALSAAQWVNQANAALAAKKYDEALTALQRAEVESPGSAEIAYNRGVAHYRLGQFDKAAGAFGDALRTRDPALEAKAKFNLGNCSYSTALQKLKDLQGAIDELRRAIGYYRDALTLNPDDREARQNIETAQLLIKDLIDKEKKRQEEEKKKQEEQEKQNPQSQPSSQPQDDQKQEKGDQKEQEPKPDQQQQQQQDEQKAGDNDQQKQKSKDKQSQSPQEKREMSREEAERKLQAVRDKERARREDRQRREAAIFGRVPVDRDW